MGSRRFYQTYDFDLGEDVRKFVSVRIVESKMTVVSVYHIGDIRENAECVFQIKGMPRLQRSEFSLDVAFDWVPVGWLTFLSLPLTRVF
ncbi:hypothetical protein [Devosia sp.]|uniref:hypothetical protein n=1 Tax=Devosia sp. TaxID=1871048 RepID=UPI0019E2B964|nr:hypothetical protein [Devosia sp.]MBE0577875.1 hypothetical protein [Devosia sp.]